jgi:non-ribosomal peptide synthetase component F
MEPVPIGAVGELYIGGAGVARGYLNRPELTAERFLVDPFSAEPGARMYRTGDLGRWLADGNIEFIGRNDFQVKIRGFRVELGEIETRLVEQEGVREAVVVAREESPGDKQLIAYYVTEGGSGAQTVEPASLREHLSERLPQYMVPAAYVCLESLPLTPNGKLDRKALPAPEVDAYAVRGFEAPQGEVETTLAQIWANLLKVERVGRHDNFFELGGHSLLAVQVISRVRQLLGVEVELRELFARPILKDFARGLAGAAQSVLPRVTRAEADERQALSFAQQRLWFLAQLDPKQSQTYHMPFGLRLTGLLDREALVKSLNRLVARHEALRTTFPAIGGEAIQRIIPPEDSQFHLVEHDLRGHVNIETELERYALEEARASFDLDRGPLIRGRLIRTEEQGYALLITMHHIVSDGWSMGVFFRELSALYRAYRQGEADPLPPMAVQYADYAAWQRRCLAWEILQEQADYWRRVLAGAPALLELPTDRPRPIQQDFAGAMVGWTLDEELTKGLKALSRCHGTTLFMTLLASWAVLLARLSGQQEVVIGTVTANRNRRELEDLIGFFVNTLALRVDVSGSPTVGELLQRVKVLTLGAQQHQDIPFEQVVEIVRPERSLAHNPLFQVMFVWQNTPSGDLELPGLKLAPLKAVPHATASFDLTLSLMEVGERIKGGLEYATALFDRSTVQRYMDHWQTLVQAMCADDQQKVDQLPLLSKTECHQWNLRIASITDHTALGNQAQSDLSNEVSS